MEEIKVGDYIRTKQWGIVKVAEINEKGECTHIKNKNNRLTHYFTQIGKPSSSVVELIEVGDIVEIFDVLHNDIVYILNEEMLKTLKEYIENGIQIKSIVTHESFNSIKYEVE